MSSGLSGFGLEGLEITENAAVKSIVQKKLLEQSKKMEKAFKTEEKNIKVAATQCAIDFVKTNSECLQKLLSKEHQLLVRQFINFRNKTWTYIDEIKEESKKMMIAERTVA